MHSFEYVDMYVGACACYVGEHVEAQGQGQGSSWITLPALRQTQHSGLFLPALWGLELWEAAQSTWPLFTSIYSGSW